MSEREYREYQEVSEEAAARHEYETSHAGHTGRYHASETRPAEGCKNCEFEAQLPTDGRCDIETYEDDPASHEDFES